MSYSRAVLPPGSRHFYELPKEGKDDQKASATAVDESGSRINLMEYVRDNVIGRNAVFSGPFGLRKVVYCDYVASGKALNCIEDFIRQHVLPMYGNTHTTTTVTSLQSTLFRHEARDIIRNSVRASEHDAVIFTGNGVTGAIHKLISALDLSKPPIIFSGPFEHHSNLLPWREIAAHVVNISETATGQVNLKHLKVALNEWKNVGLPIIGCFCAASNITGQISDTVEISKLLHKYDALAVWDYATAAPYIDIDMHPVVAEGDASKDAIFISPHKFIGGVETPGVLVAARRLFKNCVPTNCGGGSVFFVTEKDHRYLQDEEAREEGGTPNIVGSIRTGLVFKLKQDIGSNAIMERENQLYERARKAWDGVQSLELLGVSSISSEDNQLKLAIFSFMIRHQDSGLYLHYSFITALLNDVFGIQVRGGCACAGPYAQRLLGMDFETAKRMEKVLLEDERLDRTHLRRRKEYSSHEVLRPGFVRFNLPYFISDEEADFVIQAVKMAAQFGWMLLPNYMFNPDTGEWRQIKHQVFKDRKWLGHVKFSSQGMDFRNPKSNDSKGLIPADYTDCLRQAEELFCKASKATDTFMPDHAIMFDKSVKDLRWFLTPSEAQKWLAKSNQGRQVSNMTKRGPPFTVRRNIHRLSDAEILDLSRIPKNVQNMANLLLVEINKDSTQLESMKLDKKVQFDELSIDKVSPNKDERLNGDTAPSLAVPASKYEAVIGNDASDDMNIQEVNITPPVKFIPPPKRLFKLTTQAIEEFNMINDGDKVLVCLSGGKDSLSLLHTLRQYQFYAKKQNIAFDLGAVTVDPKTASYDPSPLIQYLAALGLPYFYETQAILDQALALPELTSICAFCSRMKRGRLYNCARREGWNVLAMGQHLDDLAESFLMSAFQNGLLRTMKANYVVREGDLRVIRPFVYVREKDTREFAETSKLPIIPENCPACFEAPKERHRMKQLLASQEIIHPKLFYSLKEALLPLMSKNRTGMESREVIQSTFIDDE